MTSFADTSSWELQDNGTLRYSYTHKSERISGASEKRPQSIFVQLETLSVHDVASWRLKDDESPEDEIGYQSNLFIRATGILKHCRIHTITLDEIENENFAQLEIFVYPTELERLQATSIHEQWSFAPNEDKPDGGWLKDEIGRIVFFGYGEYNHSSELSSRLFLPHNQFEALVAAIKDGEIRSAQFTVLADLYEISWEGMVADMKGHVSNYAILCENQGQSAWGNSKGVQGETKARLQEVHLEWSPKLEPQASGTLAHPYDGDTRESDAEIKATDLTKALLRIADDVQNIRDRINYFFSLQFFSNIFVGVFGAAMFAILASAAINFLEKLK